MPDSGIAIEYHQFNDGAGDDLVVTATDPTGEIVWELMLHQYDHGRAGYVVEADTFGSDQPAAQLPELFTGLGNGSIRTLDDARAILDARGAVRAR